MALETFEGKKTGWEGLWYQPDAHIYTSSPFRLSELKPFKGKVRMLVRKNKFYAKDTNRPNYQFCICDSNAACEETFEIVKALRTRFEDEQYIRVDDAVEVARGLLRDMQYGYSYDDLSVEVVRFMLDKALKPDDLYDIYDNEEAY